MWRCCSCTKMALCIFARWDASIYMEKSMLCSGIQKPMVVGNPIDYQVCLLGSHLGQVTNAKFHSLPAHALRCWADLLWAPEVGSDCSGCLVLSALIQMYFSLLGTFQHGVSQTEQIKAEVWKISRYLWNSWMSSSADQKMVKVILVPFI